MTLHEKQLFTKNKKAAIIGTAIILFTAFLGALGYASNANTFMCTVRLFLTLLCLFAFLFFYFMDNKKILQSSCIMVLFAFLFLM